MITPSRWMSKMGIGIKPVWVDNLISCNHFVKICDYLVNDKNTGRKPNSKIVTILSSRINIYNIPIWLRDKQSFTTENYKNYLLSFLN